MAIQFPPPGGQNPLNTFSPTSTPFDTTSTNNLTYVYNTTLGAWISTSGGGGGGVASLGVTAPITDTGTASVPNLGISAATTAAPGSIQLATAAEAATGTDAVKAMTPSTSVPKVLADMTGAAIIPGGDDTERAAITSPIKGMLRYNDTASPAVMEYYDGSAWVTLTVGGLTAAGGWFGSAFEPVGPLQVTSFSF